MTKLPNLAALKPSIQAGRGKGTAVPEVRRSEKELADYGIIKQNVDSILRVTPHQKRTQEL